MYFRGNVRGNAISQKKKPLLLPHFKGFGTERARLGTFRGFCAERARLGTFNQNFENFTQKIERGS